MRRRGLSAGSVAFTLAMNGGFFVAGRFVEHYPGAVAVAMCAYAALWLIGAYVIANEVTR